MYSFSSFLSLPSVILLIRDHNDDESSSYDVSMKVSIVSKLSFSFKVLSIYDTWDIWTHKLSKQWILDMRSFKTNYFLIHLFSIQFYSFEKWKLRWTRTTKLLLWYHRFTAKFDTLDFSLTFYILAKWTEFTSYSSRDGNIVLFYVIQQGKTDSVKFILNQLKLKMLQVSNSVDVGRVQDNYKICEYSISVQP